jgi:hypothetical protein
MEFDEKGNLIRNKGILTSKPEPKKRRKSKSYMWVKT